MPYYIRERYWIGDSGRRYCDDVLVELTPAEANEIVHASPADDEPFYRRVDTTYAHAWVRGGRQHETTLWIDWHNRVRK